MKKDRIQVIANWKMNPENLIDATKLFQKVVKHTTGLRNVETTICPPFVFLSDLRRKYKGARVHLGAQNLFASSKGSHTGEISPTQVLNYDVSHVIIGHSERRAGGETDEEVNEKIKFVLKHKLTPILCVGERERDGNGNYLNFLHEQLKQGLMGVSAKNLQNILIAYEPIWAIGKTGEDAITPQKLHEMILFIRKTLVTLFNKKAALEATIIYGGSVESNNARDLLVEGQAQGFLIGHASLSGSEFRSILETANSI